MKSFFYKDDEVIFDMTPNEGEEEYRIVGTNYRRLTPADVGESERFWIIAEKNNPRDKYAVRVENNNHTHVGYLSKEDNQFWHELLVKSSGGRTPAMKCRGFIGRFYNDDEELSYYGKVFLPEMTDEDRKDVEKMSREDVAHVQSQATERAVSTEKQKTLDNTIPAIIGAIILLAVVMGIILINSAHNSSSSTMTNSNAKEVVLSSAEKEIRSFISLNVPEIAWSYFDGNTCYLGFSEWDKDNVSFTCDIIAAKGNKLTNFGYHVWATSSKRYPEYSPKIMDVWGYKYETTYRYGKKEE